VEIAPAPNESRSPLRTEWIQVVAKMAALLEPLSNDDRALVMRTLSEMVGLQLTATLRPAGRGAAPAWGTLPDLPLERPASQPSNVHAAIEQCSHLGEFYAMCGGPDSAPDAVLVAAAFLQVKSPNTEGGFGTRTLNTELKHLGRAVANATATLDRLMDRRPQPITVLKKGGKTQQAHKSYKVTTAGFDDVARMLAGDSA
jgi:hypothetical protein